MSALMLIWLGWAAFTAPPVAAPEAEPVDATITAYSCDAAAPHPCGVTRWGSDPQTSGAACPEAWKLRRVFVAGEWWLCDDTGKWDYLNGLPHVDLRLRSHAAAVAWGLQERSVLVE